MIRIRPLVMDDVHEIDPRPIYHKTAKDQFMRESYYGKSFTLYESGDGKILSCVTFCFVRPHVAGINMLCDDAFVRQKREFIIVLRDGIKFFMKDLGLSRVQATIRADFKGAEKWIKILGFEKEGLMRKFGPEGEDHFLFAKVVV